MLTRRELLATIPAAALAHGEEPGVEVNDVQSRLNPTRVRRVVMPATSDELAATVAKARADGHALSVCGGRHSMGGQQFGRDTVLVDTTKLDRVLSVDNAKGLVEVQAGIQWPALVKHLADTPWAIRQKQTGVDKVCVGGSLGANIHGRGLTLAPVVGDVESFVLIGADGKPRSCSRRENADLFGLAIGGYGLFGVIVQATLRLTKRIKVRRVVEVIPIANLPARFDSRVKDGYLFGDCQYSTDLEQEAATHSGVFACYTPVPDDTPLPKSPKHLSEAEWAEFYKLARTDKPKAFAKYAEYYRSTDGQVYPSDAMQMSGNFDGYREGVDAAQGTEMITEVYVKLDDLVAFLARVRKDLVEHSVDMTYGTIRLIEKDAETFLPWARERSACVVCNLHVRHTPAGKEKAAADFRRIIDRALEFGGRFYLTYHRWATRMQVAAAYPTFAEFLKLKKKHDPTGMFQSEWWRHYAGEFEQR